MMLPERYDAIDTGPKRVSQKVGVEYIRVGIMNITPGNATDLVFFALTSANSTSQQFSNSTSGIEPFSNDLGSISFYTATLLGPLSVTDNTAGVCMGMSEGINCCVMRLPGLCAWLLGSSALGVWVERDKTGQMGVNIKETQVGPEYRQWNGCLFKLDAIRIQMGSPVAVKAVRNIGNNGLYDLLLSCWIKLGIGGEDGMEIMWWDHDSPGGYIPPWRTELSSCSAIVEIKVYSVYAIVWYFIHAVPLMCFSALVAVMDVTTSEDEAILMTTQSHPGGGQSERTEWLQQVSLLDVTLMISVPEEFICVCHVIRLDCS